MSTVIKRVGVVGCGLMGSGFADLCASAGLEVNIVVSSGASAARDRARLVSSYERRLRKGKITEAERDTAQALISFSDDPDTLSDCQFVLEAVGERLVDKEAVFGTIDRIVTDPQAVLATNTSSIPIMKIAQATSDPSRVVGVHFFNPAPVMPLVELIGSLHTAPETIDRASAFVTGTLGKSDSGPGPAGFRGERPADPLSVGRRANAGIGCRLGRGDRPGYDVGLWAPDGTARAGRHDRAGHHCRHR
ncbi:hypothetical protein GCM10029964_084900 [Kibdelosporangium lantanae]